MEALFFTTVFFIFFLGTIFGSFLNVISYELGPDVFKTKEERKKEGILSFWKRINRRSACPKCKHVLSPIELVPIFSWLGLLGKCKKCKEKIPVQYFVVEIFSGVVFLGFFWEIFNRGFSENILYFLDIGFVEFFFLIPVISAIILIFLFDWKHKIIPDVLVIPAFVYSLIFISFDFKNISFDFSMIFSDIGRSLIFALPFFAIWLVSRGRAMGFADWKLILFLSLFLESSLQNLLFVIGAFWVGAIYSLPMLLIQKSSLKSEVPFGPFIIISFFSVYFFNLSYFTFLEFFIF